MNLNASGFARGIKSVIGSVKNMNESMKDATNSASKMSSVMKGIGSSAIKVGKGLAVAGAAAATAVTALVSKSVGAFADYEQLTGGVETVSYTHLAVTVQNGAEVLLLTHNSF